jgi:hypothetical protein
MNDIEQVKKHLARYGLHPDHEPDDIMVTYTRDFYLVDVEINGGRYRGRHKTIEGACKEIADSVQYVKEQP